MADRVIVVPGAPEFLRGAVPPKMVDDLRAVSEIPEETIGAIAEELEAQEGVLNPSRLRAVLTAVLNDERFVGATVAALQNLQPERIPQTLRSLRQWRERDEGNAERFPDEALESLERKLPSLIRDYPAIVRYRKALWLSSATGNVATSFEVICDARPVFNERRDLIEGMIPLTTLKIAFEQQDEEISFLEVNLSQEMLTELIEKAQKAQQKLGVLRDCIDVWIPNGLAIVSE